MGKRDFERHYEDDEFLTRGQQVAQESAMGNPFLASESGFGPLSERSIRNQEAYEAADASIPNALIEPPQGIGRLPLAKQMLWQEYQERGLKEQVARDRELLAKEADQRTAEQEADRIKQGREIVRRSRELNPSDVKNYPMARAVLGQELAVGLTDPTAKATLESLDAVYNVAKAADDERRKTEQTFGQGVRTGRFNEAAKAAEGAGPEIQAKFLEISKTDPDGAIAYVGTEAAKSRRVNLEQQIREQQRDPSKYVTPEGAFLFGAAEQSVKGGAADRREARQLVLLLAKEKADLYKAMKSKEWTPDREAELNAARADYTALAGRPTEEEQRPGVAGMSTEYMPYLRELNPPARVAGTQPAQPAPTQPTPTPTPAASTTQPRLGGGAAEAAARTQTRPVVPAATPAPVSALPEQTISAAEASAQAGRPIAPGTILKDKFKNRILVVE